MSVVSPQARNIAVPPPVLMRRWTVDEYHRMISASVFSEDEDFELLEGWIVPKVSRNPPHDVVLDKAHEALRTRLPTGWRIRVQSAITTSDSEPEPDLAIVPGPAERYLNAHPGPADVALIVEVADASLADDQRTKFRVYARAGIAIYWIINLVDRRVEVFTDPSGVASNPPTYRAQALYSGQQVVPLVLAGQDCSIPVRELLP